MCGINLAILAVATTVIMASCSLTDLIIVLIGHRRIQYKAKMEDIEQQRLEMIEKY